MLEKISIFENMDTEDFVNPCYIGGGKNHVCTKCGWSYSNPHPSAKNRRAHKKICGTIKGFEIFDSEMKKENLDLPEEHSLDDEQKPPTPSKNNLCFGWIKFLSFLDSNVIMYA